MNRQRDVFRRPILDAVLRRSGGQYAYFFLKRSAMGRPYLVFRRLQGFPGTPRDTACAAEEPAVGSQNTVHFFFDCFPASPHFVLIQRIFLLWGEIFCGPVRDHYLKKNISWWGISYRCLPMLNPDRACARACASPCFWRLLKIFLKCGWSRKLSHATHCHLDRKKKKKKN